MHDVLCLPLAAFSAPEKPLFPIASNSHDRLAVTQIFGFALRSNPGWLADADAVLPCSGRAVSACNQVLWLCQPRGGTAALPH